MNKKKQKQAVKAISAAIYAVLERNEVTDQAVRSSLLTDIAASLAADVSQAMAAKGEAEAAV